MLTDAEIAPWRSIPVAVAVDLARDIGQIDPAIRPLRPPGQQPPLFGRAVTALCEPPDFGAVLRALDEVGPGDVLVIAAQGVREVATIGAARRGWCATARCATWRRWRGGTTSRCSRAGSRRAARRAPGSGRSTFPW
jgi:regulator of RNase E activity RraA